MSRGGRAIAALFAFAALLPARPAVALQQGDAVASDAGAAASVVAYRGGRLWDGEGFSAGDLVVRDGVFVDPSTPPDSVVDLEGRWIVPPFGDAHSHTLGTQWGRWMARDFVADGVLYGLDLTNPASQGAAARGEFAEWGAFDAALSLGGFSRLAGSRPHPATVMENAFGSGDDPPSLEGDAYWSIDDLEELDARWDDFLAQRPDVVKIYLMFTGEGDDGCGFGLCPEVAADVVRRAREAGLRVFAHVNTVADVALALEVGVDALAHDLLGDDGLTLDEANALVLPEELIVEIGRRGLVVTPTSHLLARDADRLPLDSPVVDLQAAQLRALHAAGARLALSGHDWGTSARTEAEYLVAHGIFTPAETLRIWAETTPRAIFPERGIGRLEIGYEASFLVLGRDPLVDFSATGEILRIVKQGRDVTPPADGG